MINKNGNQPCLQEIGTLIIKILRQITYPKEKKEKYEKYHSDNLFALFKNRTENNNNGPVVGEKTPVTNNDGGNKPPAKVLCCQNPVKTVDLEILNQVDQEHQIPQNLGYAKSERLASIIKKKLVI